MTGATTKPDVSLVIACYNEQSVILDSVEEIVRTLKDQKWSFEIIFVDDASQDDTRELIQSLINKEKRYPNKFIAHETNLGRGAAVTTGILAAKGNYVGFIDIDLEIHASYIPLCLHKLTEGFDVVTGRRLQTFQWRTLHRILLSKGYSYLVRNFLRVPLCDTETGLKFFARDRIGPILDQTRDTGWFWDTEIMVRSYLEGLRIHELPCEFRRRYDKKSTVRLFPDTLNYAFNLIRFRSEIRSLRNKFRAA